MTRFLLRLLLALVLCACLPVAALSQQSILIETLLVATPNGKPAMALIVNGQTVVRLAKTQRNRDPLRAVTAATVELAAAYRSGRSQISVAEFDEGGRQWGVYLDGELFLVATDQEAKAWGVEPMALASTWMNNLNSALSQAAPAGNVPAGKPAGGSGGQDQGQRGESQRNSGLITSGGHKVFDPPAAGSTGDSFAAGSDRVVVTGSSAGSDIVREGIDNLIRRRNQLPPDARISWKSEEAKVGPGGERLLSLDWTARRPGGADGSGSLQLTLENRRVHLPREEFTYFSNKPERVSRAQLLYYATLESHSAGRLVFHHQNQSGTDLDFVARLLNQGSQPASVHVIPGLTPADVNTFYVGYKSAEKYWSNLNSGNGYVLDIPAGGQVLIANQRMEHGATVSGYMTLSNLGDADLRLETMSINHSSPVPPWPLENHGEASYCVFGEPFINSDLRYDTGDNWLYLRLGNQLPPSSTDDSVLHGCYGMTHSYNVELQNVKDGPALVFVVLRASAGEVKGQFFIDDEFVGTALVASGEELLLKDIPLKPGETKLLKIRAIPLNGGFYPASIIIREQRYP